MKSLNTVLLSTLIFCSSNVFAADHKVDIKGMVFSPATLTVEVGDTVTFTNRDGVPHTGTATDKSFDTGFLSEGQSGTVDISKAGAFEYFCMVHPSMKGEITAEAAAPVKSDSGAVDSTSSDY